MGSRWFGAVVADGGGRHLLGRPVGHPADVRLGPQGVELAAGVAGARLPQEAQRGR